MEAAVRQAQIEQLEKFLELAKAHEQIQVPDSLTVPIIIGVTQPVKTRQPRKAIGSHPLPTAPAEKGGKK